MLRATRSVFAVIDKQEDGADDKATLHQRIAQLEEQLARATKSNRGARGSSSRKASSNKETSARVAAGYGKPGTPPPPRISPDTYPCHICGELGHWCWDCPKCKAKGKDKEVKVQTVQAVSANLSPTKIYVTAEVNGEPV